MPNRLSQLFGKKAQPEPPQQNAPAPAPISASPDARLSARDILNSTVINAAGNVNLLPQPLRSASFTLPQQRPFAGRASLVAQVKTRVCQNDVVSVTSLKGVGGVGKTALALRAAYECGDVFVERHWLDLRGVSEPSGVLRNFARAIGAGNDAQVTHGDYETLLHLVRSHFYGKRALLVLDNADLLAEQHPDRLDALKLPHPCATLVTSRIAIDPAHDIRVDVLSDDDALALLQLKGLDMAAQREDALSLVSRLGHLALALDITGSRMAATQRSCAQALRQLDESANLLDELKLRTGHAAHASAQNSVAESFALSYALIDEDLRAAFGALGVCAASGADVQAIAVLLEVSASESRFRLEALARLSLASFQAERAELHPLLREYAHLRTTENPAALQAWVLRHAKHFGKTIGGGLVRAIGEYRDSTTEVKAIDAERDNVTLAQNRVLAAGFPDAHLAVALTDDLQQYWWTLRHEPAVFDWLQKALALAEASGFTHLQANVLKAIGDVQAFRDERDAALVSYANAQALFEEIGAQVGQANVLQAIGDVQAFRKDNDAALISYANAQALFEKVGAQLGQANVLKAIGDVQVFRDERDAALVSYVKAQELFEKVGAQLGQAYVLQAIGDVQAFRDERDAALVSYANAQALFEKVGDQLGQAIVLKAIGYVQAFRKDNVAALVSYANAQTLFEKIGDSLGQANVLQAIGDVQAFRKDNVAALVFYTKAQELYEKVGDPLGQANLYLATGRMNNDDAAFERAIGLYERIGDVYSLARAQFYFGVMKLNAPGGRDRGVELLQAAQAGWTQINFERGLQMISNVLKQ